MCVLDIKIFVGFVPLECADELCYMIVEVAHTTASGIDWDHWSHHWQNKLKINW